MTPDTYSETRRAIDDARWERKQGANSDDWAGWIKLVITIAAMIVSVTWAWSNLDKRISLMEQKLDYIVIHTPSNK